MTIIAITNKSDYPWELLLLADPEASLVAAYLKTSETFVKVNSTSEVLGVLVLNKEAEDHYELMNLAVAEAYQSMGIGQELVEYGIKEIKSRQQSEARLIVKTGDLSYPAIRLYQRCGFQIKEVIEDYFIKNYPEAIYEEGQQLKNQLILELLIN